MLTTHYLEGPPSWVALSTSDVDAALDSYHRVLGWDPGSAGPDPGGYRMLRSDGAVIGGAGPLMADDQPVAWEIYFNTGDVRATVRSAQELGASVMVEPMDVMGLGHMAYLADPQGGGFSLWQPASFAGMERTDVPGTLMWTELWTPSAQGAKDFYGRLFEWGFNDIRLDEDTVYTTVRPHEAGEDRYFGGIMGVDPAHLPATEGAADWHPVFHVTDCDRASSAVTEAGGQVYVGPESTPGVGRLAVCADPFSAGFVLLAPSPE
ncbi:VOC family protein [Nocardiopsis xinjiangensis]|uniref:VOC family protein n=1 Tax=Nocardiopsis xinjiangensis TaxID=124285 RepID=UPI0003480346|nr:VOC family protein [Nocardiopsis xinjiangensis]